MIANNSFIGIRNEPKVIERSETEMKRETFWNKKKHLALIESKS